MVSKQSAPSESSEESNEEGVEDESEDEDEDVTENHDVFKFKFPKVEERTKSA